MDPPSEEWVGSCKRKSVEGKEHQEESGQSSHSSALIGTLNLVRLSCDSICEAKAIDQHERQTDFELKREANGQLTGFESGDHISEYFVTSHSGWTCENYC